MTGMRRVSELVDPALKTMGIRSRVREEQLRIALAHVVGDALAGMCRAERLDRGALLIATASSALAHQLQLDSVRVIRELNAALGVQAVHRLRFTALSS
jgi:hypothetical protein